MTTLNLYIRFGGNWDDERLNYTGGEIKCLIADKSITYLQLMEKIYRITKVGTSEFQLKLEYVANFNTVAPTIKITNDYDLEFFKSCSVTNQYQQQLYVSLEQKEQEPDLEPELEIDINTEEPHVLPTVPLGEDRENPWELYSQAEEDHNDNWCAWGSSGTGYSHVYYADPQYEADTYHPIDTQYSVDNQYEDTMHSHEQCRPQSDYIPSLVFPTTSSGVENSIPTLGESSSSSGSVEVGHVFFSKKELSMKLSVMAMHGNFEFRVKKSTKQLFTVGCIHKTCKWRLRAVCLQGSDMFKVSKFINDHTCSLELMDHDHRQARSWVIGNLIKSKYEGSSRQYKPRDIMEDMRKEYGVNISYDKAWRSREEVYVLARGSLESSYGTLRAYGEALKIENPGSVFDVKLEDDIHFKYVFMALGPCIGGFLSSIRRVIVVDGTFLKGKYRGTLVVSAAIDPNNNIYPIAFAIVDRENDDSWTWFMSKLGAIIGQLDGLVILSDRNSCIAKACSIIFPAAFHALCIYHLSNNLKSKFKDHDSICQLFLQCAKAFRQSVFREFWSRLSAFEGVRSYLEEVGVVRWARAFQAGRRYDQMTTNIAECMNAILKDARELPLTALLEHIRGMLQRWFHERRTIASAYTSSPVAQHVEEELRKLVERARTYTVYPIDYYKFDVRDDDRGGIVDLNTRQCSCKEFDCLEIPCAHAVATAMERNISVYTLCSEMYNIESWMLAYAEPIYPVGHVSEWRRSSDFVDVEVLPPKTVARVGRRRMNRITSIGETRLAHKCGRCGNQGHNRKTCTTPLSTNT